MVDSWENNDPNYTLKSIYDSAPESTRKDASSSKGTGNYN